MCRWIKNLVGRARFWLRVKQEPVERDGIAMIPTTEQTNSLHSSSSPAAQVTRSATVVAVGPKLLSLLSCSFACIVVLIVIFDETKVTVGEALHSPVQRPDRLLSKVLPHFITCPGSGTALVS